MSLGSLSFTKFVFRVDASVQIGTGHVMRCLTLANALREQGVMSRFICRLHPGNLIAFIIKQGFEVDCLPVNEVRAQVENEVKLDSYSEWLGTDWETDAVETIKVLNGNRMDWLVVDHYSLESRWEKKLRSNCGRIMVIDDLVGRSHDCDLLLNQNLGLAPYDFTMLPLGGVALVGPQFALLRPEFQKFRDYSLSRRMSMQFKRLLITMGGIDKDNVTGAILDSLKICPVESDMKITVVMGANAPSLHQVQKQALKMECSTQVLVDVPNMAEIMANNDFAIGAAGSSSWERCCLGLPTIQLILADNQIDIANALAHAGAAISTDIESLKNILSKIIHEKSMNLTLFNLGLKASSIVDGAGAARVVQEIMGVKQ